MTRGTHLHVYVCNLSYHSFSIAPTLLRVDCREQYEVLAPGTSFTSLGLPLFVGVSVKALGA